MACRFRDGRAESGSRLRTGLGVEARASRGQACRGERVRGASMVVALREETRREERARSGFKFLITHGLASCGSLFTRDA